MYFESTQVSEAMLELITLIDEHPDEIDIEKWLPSLLMTLAKQTSTVSWLYKPDVALVERINDYKKWCSNPTSEEPGKLMEEIAFLAFRCIKGYSSVKSYQSYAAQHDLVISGTDSNWQLLLKYIGIDRDKPAIVIEAKNLKEKVDDKQFARLCGILHFFFNSSSELGVFVSKNRATGFPDGSSRRRALRDSLATQIVFHARTGKYVIVLDHSDIEKLSTEGMLPTILRQKIKSVEEWTGLPSKPDFSQVEVDLPEHLMKHQR